MDMLLVREICSQKHLCDYINFLIDVFVENGHGCNHMLAIINEKCNRKMELTMTVTSRTWSKYRRYQSLDQN